jgi:hypothetical protein
VRVMQRFRQGKIMVLIATEAARMVWKVYQILVHFAYYIHLRVLIFLI